MAELELILSLGSALKALAVIVSMIISGLLLMALVALVVWLWS